MSLPRLRISAFFPAYNEQDNLGPLTEEAVEMLSRLCDDYEVILVNDGSRDRTGQVADELAQRFPNVRAVHHPQNRGYGGALKTGFASARLDHVFFTDSDRQFRIQEIELLLPYAERYDIVAGYRIRRQDHFMRLLNAKAWNLLCRVVLGVRVRDIDCAFKLFKRSVFDTIHPTSDGAVISTEIFALAKLHGLSVKQVGVHHHPRRAGVQTGASLRVILKAFRELFALKRRLRKAGV
jgi:glycosyltransferase involved in cell wall biosynthesis